MIQLAFDYGAKQVTGGSVAVKNPELFEGWLQSYGGEKIILGADARDEKIAISGWEEATEKSVYEFVGEYIQKGAKYTISTDVAKDGLLQGPSFDLYQNLQDQFPDLHIIASGGVATFDDIVKLNEMNIFGVIVGKAIYEGRVTLKQLAELHQ
jgi:phosphoribosylformimino-5-aminoimidazole carboxamide ribotide isomerase